MIVNERDNQPVFIGYVGENNSRPVPFYVGDIIEKYPDATFSLIHKRQGDEDGYPVNSAYWDVEDKILTWRPQSGDLAAEGIGELQIKASNDGDIIKTKVYKTDTHGALGESADPPSPWEGWLEQFEDEAAEAAEAAEDAAESASAAQAAVNNFAPDYSELTFPIAEGTLCAHSGGYYVANQDISTSEEWTAAHWTATNIGTQLGAVKSALTSMTVEEKLLRDELPGTSKAVTFDANDNPVSIVHSADGQTVRTDVFVWSTNTVTETRTASNKYITITTNLETLAQTISEVQGVA